jgi:hypothetical protein
VAFLNGSLVREFGGACNQDATAAKAEECKVWRATRDTSLAQEGYRKCSYSFTDLRVEVHSFLLLKCGEEGESETKRCRSQKFAMFARHLT